MLCPLNSASTRFTRLPPVSPPHPTCSHRCQTVVLAAGFNAEQLAPVKGVELEEADLGRANYQEKVEGVRAARHWRAMGRVSSATCELQLAAGRGSSVCVVVFRLWHGSACLLGPAHHVTPSQFGGSWLPRPRAAR